MNKKILLTLGALLLHTAAWSQSTPVGLWKTIDDETKAEKSLVRVADNAGVLTGTIEKLFDPAKQKDICELCTDDRKDKPVLGMVVVRNARQDASDPALWTGGDIVDPKNGKVYKLRMKPLDGGKTLEVRGYIGPFYRNQTWIRVE
jgi:uncharacterized protein (DUF2147 family)